MHPNDTSFKVGQVRGKMTDAALRYVTSWLVIDVGGLDRLGGYLTEYGVLRTVVTTFPPPTLMQLGKGCRRLFRADVGGV